MTTFFQSWLKKVSVKWGSWLSIAEVLRAESAWAEAQCFENLATSRATKFWLSRGCRPFHVNQGEMSLCTNLVPEVFPLEIRKGRVSSVHRSFWVTVLRSHKVSADYSRYNIAGLRFFRNPLPGASIFHTDPPEPTLSHIVLFLEAFPMAIFQFPQG